MDHNFIISSFNCQGVKHKLPFIFDLCSKSHVVFLQETWLLPDELNMLNDVHANFNLFSLSSVNTEDGILVEHPYGGISILWNKSISSFCKVIQFDDNRLLGLSIVLGDLEYIFLNVYLPYHSLDNYNEYDMYM